MNYNNYNNPYNNIPYSYMNSNYGQPQMNYGYNQPQMQMQQQAPQQQNQQMQQPQQNFLTFIVVNDFSSVDKYIVGANQTINFYDSKNGYIFQKNADGMGKYTIKTFKLMEIDTEEVVNGKEIKMPNYLVKDDLKEYVTVTDFKRLEKEFKDTLEHMGKQLSNNYRNNNSNTNNRRGNNYEQRND